MQYQFPHLENVNINGMAYEAAIIKRDTSNNDLYFIRIDYLDDIDRSRMRTILMKRDAAKYQLWDLLDQTTLPNGMNGLEYFDQYVQGITVSGALFKPSLGRRGAMLQSAQPPAPQQAPQQQYGQPQYVQQPPQAPQQERKKKEG